MRRENTDKNIDTNIDINVKFTEEQREQINKEIEYLSGFMLPERFETIKRVVDNRTDYLTVCLENIFYSQNASAIIRSSEAFGIQNIHATEQLCDFEPNVDIVRGADKWVNIERYRGNNTTEELVEKLRADGYRIVATSPHINGTSAEDYDITKGKTAVFFGTEKQGISDTLKELADDFIQIDMYGFMESFNVSVAASIVLNGLTRSLHKSDLNWKLDEDKRLQLLHSWVKQSVKDAELILARME